jgi:hypothetical protein
MQYFPLLLALTSISAVAAETPLDVPSDPKARYFVLEKVGKGAERTILTKRVGPSGTSFSRRLYNCSQGTVKYLGTGDTLEQMKRSKPDANMSPIVNGSIAFHVGREACRT